ncbi:MAG: BPL-N domain-containing protein [Thermodesulfovibrionales bacterium]|nr:BPL-N domain-containing protein [Thermodesulfovibrionales bacterium]
MKSSKLKPAVFLWDESFLWGLMAYKALKANGLPFELIRAEDVKKGCLKNYAMLFVPGGWASNKLKTLGDKGAVEIKKFVSNGGNYLGFCGGAGLATLDGIGLLNIKRKPTKERVPSFSGRIHLNINEHPIWNGLVESSNETNPPFTKVGRGGINSSPVFHAWWPSQFLINDKKIKNLAVYGNALPDSFSSDLNVGDVEGSSGWKEFEKIYGINLDPKRLLNEPAVVEGKFGRGRVILSLIHFDTSDDVNGARVLKNLWEYLAESSVKVSKCQSVKDSDTLILGHSDTVLSELESAVTDLISLGIRNFLWFWRNPMLLQWRRGVRGLEYCTLYVMIKELSGFSGQLSAVDKEELQSIKKLLIPFTEKAKHLLILERHTMQNGHITYERCNNPAIQKIRIELFGDSKSHGGLFKSLIDEVDAILFSSLPASISHEAFLAPSP